MLVVGAYMSDVQLSRQDAGAVFVRGWPLKPFGLPAMLLERILPEKIAHGLHHAGSEP